MSQKFLSSVTLAGLASGSILKVNSDGLIVEAVAGTDYVSSVSYGDLNSLTDVVVSNPSADQILVYGQPLGGDPGVNIWYNKTPNYLTSYTETDPIYTASSWYTTANNSSNWDTAYGWGNHAGLYANLIHTHSVFTQATSDVVGGEEVIVPGSNGFVPASGFDDGSKFLRGDGTWQVVTTDLTGYATETWVGQQGYLTSYAETDPVFVQSAAYNVRTEDINAWNTAYEWGDHGGAGYLTSFTETDPIYTASSWYTTTNNSTNWNTAYGWGNHAGLYADLLHTHEIGDIAELQDTLDRKIETESDPVYTGSTWYTTTNNATDWDTAYGWGNHALAGYLTSETDSQELEWNQAEKLLTISNGNTVDLSQMASVSDIEDAGFITAESDTLATVTARGATTSGSMYIGTGTIYLPNSISGRTAQIEFGNLTSGDILGIPNQTTTFYLSYGTDQIHFRNDNSGELQRFKNNGDVVFINNVGIGTTSPFGKLNVSRPGINEGAISFDDQASNAHLILAGTDALVRMQLGTYNNGSYGAWIQASYDNGGVNYGTESLILNPQGGNVGIGTTSPGAKLEIAGFSTGAGLKLNYGNSSGTIEAVNFIANGAANGVIGMQMVSAGVGDLWLGGSGGRSLTLYRDGNVGIGTTSPAYKLQVEGNVSIGSDATGLSNPKLVLNTTSYRWFTQGVSGSYRISQDGGGDFLTILPTSGNVGIGTTSPGQALDVNGNINATGVISQTFWTNDSIRKLYDNASLNFRKAAGPIEMVLDGSGNLVVGGISPNASNGAKIFGLKSESGKYFTQNAFGQDGGYTWPSTTYVTGNDNSPVGNTTFRGSGAFQGHVTEDYIPIDATKTYKVSVWMRAVSGSPVCYLSHRQYYWDYSPGNPGNGGWGNPYWWVGAPSSSWTEYSMTIGPDGSGADHTHMADVKFIRHGWLHNYTGDGSATAEFQGWKVEELDSILANNVTVMGSAVATQSWVTSQGYLTSETDSQTLDWSQGEKTLTISNGNSVDLAQMASIQDVENYGFITAESDTLATVTARGATTNGNIVINGEATIQNNGYLRLIAGSSQISGFTVFNASASGYLSNRITTGDHARGWGWEFTTNEATNDAGAVYFRVGYGGADSYLNSGNFGIGTTAPNAKLDVAGNTRLGSGTLHVSTDQTFVTSFTYSFRDAVGIVNPNGTSAALGTAVMSIGGMSNGTSLITTGNVGIGTTSPQNKLSIGSSQEGGIDFLYDSSNAYKNQIKNYWNSNADSRMDFNIGRTANVAPVTVMSVGYNSNVGIGTTVPTQKLHVAGNGLFEKIGIGSINTTYDLYNNGSSYLNGEVIIDDRLYLSGALGGISQDNIIGRPKLYWGASASSTGAVTIKFPGGFSNYGMVHAVIDIYEYSNNNVCTIIVGGHNWNGRWYAYGANVTGYTDKPVRVAYREGRYEIIIGDNNSSWSYGQVVLRKIQNGNYYAGSMNVSDGYEIEQIPDVTAEWISEDLRSLKTAGSLTVYGSSNTEGSVYIYGKDAFQGGDSYLRLNNSGNFTSGVYTPAGLRNDGAFDNYGGIYGYATIRGRKAQTDGTYTTAALWTESYDNTTTGIAFHISGVVGKFLEMRTNGSLYWDGSPLPTQAWVTSQGYTSTTYVDEQIAALVDSAPEALNTLKELSNALGDDQNFATNVTNSIAGKVSKSGDTMTGDLTLNYGYPRINFYDSNHDSDYSLINNDGGFSLYDITNNVHRWWVTPGGNVGIGTTSPNRLLTVSQNGAGNGSQNITAQIVNIATGATSSAIYIGALAGADWLIGKNIYGTTSLYNFQIGDQGISSSYLDIAPGGNVGIGTTSPSYKLDVDGIARTSGLYFNGGFRIYDQGQGYATFNNWVNLPGVHGFYSGINSAHIYPNDGTYGAWRIDGTRNGWNGIEFDASNGRISLMVNPNSNSSGFHNNSYGWQVEWSNGTLYCSKNAYGGGVQAAVLDSVNYTSYAATSAQGSNADTAYGWGNHATANYWSTSSPDPQIIAAGSVTFQYDVEVQGTFSETSARRYKENIVDLEPVTDKVYALRPVRYNKIGSETQEIGLIAEEVAELFPEVVHYNDDGQPESLNYTRLSVLLLQTVKELSERIQKLENK